MPTIRKETTVHAPLGTVYAVWRNFENFPAFMQYIDDVHVTSDRMSHWRASGPLGLAAEWDAEMTLDAPNEAVAWRTVEGASSVVTAGRVSFEEEAPGHWLLNRVPWSAAEHTIRAIAADETIAAALGITVGTACLTVERRTWSNGAYITHVRLIYPGERHALVANFTPTQPK